MKFIKENISILIMTGVILLGTWFCVVPYGHPKYSYQERQLMYFILLTLATVITSLEPLFRWVAKVTHIHNFKKPLASMYVGFYARDIVFECKCGKRIIKRLRHEFSEPFPIETNVGIKRSELEKIANSQE